MPKGIIMIKNCFDFNGGWLDGSGGGSAIGAMTRRGYNSMSMSTNTLTGGAGL